MEVMEVQDTRDDASLEAVASVGGDDVAADDGYDDGYDGEDPEEEEAPEEQANHLVHPEEEQFMPTRAHDVKKQMLNGTLPMTAPKQFYKDSVRTEKELGKDCQVINQELEQIDSDGVKHSRALETKIMETQSFVSNLPNNGEVLGHFAQTQVAPILDTQLQTVERVKAVMNTSRGAASPEHVEMARELMIQTVNQSYDLSAALFDLYGKSDKMKKVLEAFKSAAGEELRLIANQRLIATMNSEQQPRVGSATRHFRLSGSGSRKRRRTSSPTPAQ